MFGNAKGWVMSAVIFVLTGALIWYAGRPPLRSKPTGQFAVALQSSAVALDYASIVPPGTKEQDAAETLRDLADKVKDKRIAFDDFLKTPAAKDRRTQAPKIDRELKLLLEAAKCAKLGGLAKPDELVVYGDKPYLTALKRAGEAANQYALAIAFPDARDTKFKPDPAKAKQYVEASFQLGRMLYEDRVIFKQWRDGLELMKFGAFYLAAVDNKKTPGLKEKCDAFSAKVTAAMTPAVTAWADISHTNQARFPGDVFLVAETSPDPMWRSEALLKLGRMRWMKGVQSADQRDAKLVLEQTVAQQGLPAAVRVAADRALKLDADSFQETDRDP
jgi:hypothetical protein